MDSFVRVYGSREKTFDHNGYALLEPIEGRVAEHNNFARRMPVVEEQIKVVNHRLEDLEHEKTAR